MARFIIAHMLAQRIQQQFIDSADLKYQCAQTLAPAIEAAIAALVASITGGGKELPATVTDYLDRVRGSTTLPVCAGFGVRRADQVKSLGRHAAGCVVGSALVEELEAGRDPVAFLRGLRAPG